MTDGIRGSVLEALKGIPAGFGQQAARQFRRAGCWGVLPVLVLLTMILCPALAQENVITLSTNVGLACGGNGMLSVQFQQPGNNNLVTLSFNIRFDTSQFDSVYLQNGNHPSDDKPIIAGSALLTGHALTAQPIVPDPDSNPNTADWMILVYTQESSFPLIPNGIIATMKFFTTPTTANGNQLVKVYNVVGVNALAVEYALAGTSGSFSLSSCITPSRNFLPLLLRP